MRLTADRLVEVLPEAPHHLSNTSAERLRIFNVKSLRATKATYVVVERSES